MSSVSFGAAAASSTEAMLVQNADADTGTNATLVKKALQSDRDLVDTLLQPAPSPAGAGTQVDVHA